MSLAEMPWEVREVPLERLYGAVKAWHGDAQQHRRDGHLALALAAERQREHYLDLCAMAVMLFGDEPPDPTAPTPTDREVA